MKKYVQTSYDLTNGIDCFDELPLWSAPFGMKLLEYVDYRKGITALDIGFGTGFPLTELAMRLGASSTVYGIDCWKEAIARAKNKIAYYLIDNITIIEASAEAIPLAANAVDLVVSNNGINNVGDMNAAISECARIVKAGGQFVQTMNLDTSMIEFYGVMETVLSELHMDSEIDALYRHIYQKRRPLVEVLSMLRRHGFLIKDAVQDQFAYTFADGTAMLHHYFIRLAFMGAWMNILPADRAEQIFDTIETRLNEQARLTGGMQLSIPYVVINAIKK